MLPEYLYLFTIARYDLNSFTLLVKYILINADLSMPTAGDHIVVRYVRDVVPSHLLGTRTACITLN